MAGRITRREMLRRSAGVLGAAGFASFTGLGALGRAMAAQGGGARGVLMHGCGEPPYGVIYGCTTVQYCAGGLPHSCPTEYNCTVDVSCSYPWPTEDAFICTNTGANPPDPYGCTERNFKCMLGPPDEHGTFECQGEADPYAFICHENTFQCGQSSHDEDNITFDCSGAFSLPC